MAVNQQLKEYRVNTLPISGLIAGNRYHLDVGNGKYKTFIVSDNLQLIGNAGAEFIEKDTMSQFRNISSREIWAIQNGYYKGVKLNGYYSEGDTPTPIEYYITDTSIEDDGGSVIEVGDVKFEHIFNGYIDVRYFGCVLDGVTDNLVQFQKCLDIGGVLYIGRGKLAVIDSLIVKSNTSIIGDDKFTSTIMWADNSVSPGHTSDENFLLRVIGKNNISFQDITLDANGFNQDDIFRNSILELRDY